MLAILAPGVERPAVARKGASISEATAVTAMTSATIARWVRGPKSSLGRSRSAADEERSGDQADEPRREVLDVPQQPGLEDHGDEEGAQADAHPAPPHGLHHGGQRCDDGVAAGGDAEVGLPAELDGPRPARVDEDAQEPGREQHAEGLPADHDEQRAPVTDPALVGAGGEHQQQQDRDVDEEAAA